MIRTEKITLLLASWERVKRFPKLLLLGDGCFVLMHAAYVLDVVHNPIFSVETDFGYAEMYQYLKLFLMVLLLLWAARKSKQLIYLAWSALFSLVTLDDALSVHENFGAFLAERFGFQAALGLRPVDFGEMTVFAVYGAFLVIFVGGLFWVSDRLAQRASKSICLLMLAFAFFACVVDMLHVAVSWGGHAMTSFLGLVEDGGEMITISILLAYFAQFALALPYRRQENV